MQEIPIAFRPLYDNQVTQPMRDELTSIGIRELKTPNDVDEAVKSEGTVMIFVNSVCGCAAGGARPALRIALQHDVIPDVLTTVFAGQDREATARAREYFLGFPPSSPSLAILRNGQVEFFLPRHHIEGKPPELIAEILKLAFDKLCRTHTTSE